MKKYYLLLFLFTIASLSFLLTPKSVSASGCERIYGKFTATNWPGGKVHVECNGDNPPGPNNCTGGSADIGPGESFDFPSCSCLPTAQGPAKTGCLSITNIPTACVPTSNFDAFCGKNGQEIPADFGLDCKKPEVACNESCDTKNGDRDCQGAKDGCTVCRASANGNPTCQKPPENTPPPATPATPVPACNTPCKPGNGDRECVGAKDGCTVCSSGGVCTKPPSATPTPNITCNSTCVRDDDCIADAKTRGCTKCLPTSNGGKSCQPPPGITPGPTSTPAPPTATNTPQPSTPVTPPATVPPTVPPFNENWCTCDGLESNPASFFPGQAVNFTAFGKVEPPYLTRAKVQSIRFRVFRGGSAEQTLEKDSGYIGATLESQTAAKNRYKAVFPYTIPTNIKQGELFRVQADVKCVAQNVLGAAIKYEPSFIDRIVSLIGFIFGLAPQPVATDYQPVVTPTESAMIASPTSQVLAAQNSLQIGTFTESKIIEKSCKYMRFKFGN